MATSVPTNQEKLWIAAWRSAGPELERIRNQELRNLSDEQATRQATFLGIVDTDRPRPASSICELQKWMIRWRKKLEEAE